MLTTDDLRFFAIVAKSDSLAAVARHLNVTPPAVTQRLNQLEARLKVRFTDRSTRHLRLTDEGELLAARGRPILEELDALSEALDSRRSAVTGHLRVVAPFGFGRRFIAPIVSRFGAQHPDLTLSLVLAENTLQVNEQKWDLMVHIGELPDSTMIGQVLAPNRRVLCASRDYLARRGTPMTPAELEFHDVAAIRENDEDTTLWRFASVDGRIESVRIRPKMTSNDGEIVRSWATAGCGIIVRSEWDVAQDLHAGNLVEILGKHSLPDANIMALTTARNGRAARTTRFLGELQAAFQPIPWRGLTEPRMLG